jgi:hypothetical protein
VHLEPDDEQPKSCASPGRGEKWKGEGAKSGSYPCQKGYEDSPNRVDIGLIDKIQRYFLRLPLA